MIDIPKKKPYQDDHTFLKCNGDNNGKLKLSSSQDQFHFSLVTIFFMNFLALHLHYKIKQQFEQLKFV